MRRSELRFDEGKYKGGESYRRNSTVHNWRKQHVQDGASDMNRMFAHDLRHMDGTRRIGGLSVGTGTQDIDIRKHHVVKS